MDIILWRHAEAEDGTPDAARKLTAKGQKQAQQMAAWLTPHLPNNTRIFVSPATRTQQTAAALGRDFETVKEVGLSANTNSLLTKAGWPHADGAVLVVGHQPTLGEARRHQRRRRHGSNAEFDKHERRTPHRHQRGEHQPLEYAATRGHSCAACARVASRPSFILRIINSRYQSFIPHYACCTGFFARIQDEPEYA